MSLLRRPRTSNATNISGKSFTLSDELNDNDTLAYSSILNKFTSINVLTSNSTSIGPDTTFGAGIRIGQNGTLIKKLEFKQVVINGPFGNNTVNSRQVIIPEDVFSTDPLIDIIITGISSNTSDPIPKLVLNIRRPFPFVPTQVVICTINPTTTVFPGTVTINYIVVTH